MGRGLGHLPVIVVGAGPVGLAAAAHLTTRGLPFTVVESGDQAGAAVLDWGHVRLFSRWKYNIDGTARQLLRETGWKDPDPEVFPNGAELVSEYLRPLSGLSAIEPYVRYGAQVVGVSRLDYDRLRTDGRDAAPFVVRLADGDELVGRAVIDASGTWHSPNPLGGSGLPAIGETDVGHFIDRALPDVLAADRARYAGCRTVVVGSGQSAATTLLALARLAEQVPETSIVWALRRPVVKHSYHGESAAALAGGNGARLRAHIDNKRIEQVTDFSVHTVRPDADGRVELADQSGRTITADRIVSATGFHPDHTVTSELRVDFDPTVGSPRAMGPLIDPNIQRYETLLPHTLYHLVHPEQDFYTVGVKSFGRAPLFLLFRGYLQVKVAVRALG